MRDLLPQQREPSIATATTMPQNFVISQPSRDAAARIAEIHLAAMDSNSLLHAQFPTAEGLEALQQFLTVDAAAKLSRSTPGILVAQDPDTDKIIGIVKWHSPSQLEETKVETGSVQQIPGCRREFLDGYIALAEEAKKRSFGSKPSYWVSFVCIDPAYQSQGAGSLLMREIMDMASSDGLPVYLESTENAVGMYRKLGFEPIDSFEMVIPTPAGSAEPQQVYRESCMVWQQPPESG